MAIWCVFYEGWQMECCGKPFSVGDEVSWPLASLDPAHFGARGWGEERYAGLHKAGFHADGGPVATGRVRAIRLVYRMYEEVPPGSRSFQPVPGDMSLKPVDTCPKWFHDEESKPAPAQKSRRMRRCDGVLVDLEVEVPGASPS
jgi:hypothetical protein